MPSYWKTATGEIADLMNALPKGVVSGSLKNADWTNARVLADGLRGAGLIDEFRLGLVPLVLGGGTPHFKPQATRRSMTLVESRVLNQGLVLLRYEYRAGRLSSRNWRAQRRLPQIEMKEIAILAKSLFR